MAYIGKIITKLVKFSKQHSYFYLGITSLISLIFINNRFQQDYALHQVKNGPEICTQRIHDLYAMAIGHSKDFGINQKNYITKTKECIFEMLVTYDELMAGSRVNKNELEALKNQLQHYAKTLNDFLEILLKNDLSKNSLLGEKLINITKSLEEIRQNFSLIKQINFHYLPLYLGFIFASIFLLTFFQYLTKKIQTHQEQLLQLVEIHSKELLQNIDEAGINPIEDYLKTTFTKFKLFYTQQLFSEWSKKIQIYKANPTPHKDKLVGLVVGNKQHIREHLGPKGAVK